LLDDARRWWPWRGEKRCGGAELTARGPRVRTATAIADSTLPRSPGYHDRPRGAHVGGGAGDGGPRVAHAHRSRLLLLAAWLLCGVTTPAPTRADAPAR